MSKKRRNKKAPDESRDKSASPEKRKPRILWANVHCLLDLSSGASMAVNEILVQLHRRGYEIMVLGATIFDSEKGMTRIREQWDQIQSSNSYVVKVETGDLVHRLVKTKSIARQDMTAEEEGIWHNLYQVTLNEFKPDLVYYYGGGTLELLIPDEAHARGIPSVAHLGNGTYQGQRWCRDVDLILTASYATSKMYQEKYGFIPQPIGTFIDADKVVASEHSRQHVLLVNPSLEKGAAVVIAMASILEKKRPHITFEVVESRGDWETLVWQVTEQLGEPRMTLDNVIITPNTADMRPIYGRARILLALSLCWESFGRVAAEAMMNGIPAIVTNRGGLPEVTGEGGIKVGFPEACYEAPYTKIPNLNTLEKITHFVEHLFDDQEAYDQMVQKAFAQGQQHRMETSMDRLITELTPLLEQRAGDHQKNLRPHKQLKGNARDEQ